MSEEDDIEASKAPLIEHLIELRSRLIRAIIAIVIAFIVCFAFAKSIYNFLVWPYDLTIRHMTGKPAVMIFTAPQEFFITQIKVAFYGALFFAFPVIATQIYKFVAPGLYKHEKQAFTPYLIATPVFFVLGAALVYFMLPMVLGFFAGMQQTGEGEIKIELLPRVSEYLSLIMSLTFAFGIVFQMPVVLTLLARIGFLTSTDLRERRRWAILIAFVAAAVLTPPDPLSQISLAIPTILLYELTILAVRFVERQKEKSAANAS
ncbi:twin-arginine translocase subunit TatC [Prosthecodimorpha staleyi]|uniref:Sec-independent protein translocase protein TatC n=1 Tax=Prosthecodimorpha staleyi TaxID=2840188 RepID=A0A947GGH0_9HYPH|nr:twin-arginine translocase subunit TatC [Prosthecodimorpha staleyi]MBT9292205.1 twin-arginine translocase subunit TatC [Prosthecodimorpha staleyi]